MKYWKGLEVKIKKEHPLSYGASQANKSYPDCKFTIVDYREERDGISYKIGIYYIIEAVNRLPHKTYRYEIHESSLESIVDIRNKKLNKIL